MSLLPGSFDPIRPIDPCRIAPDLCRPLETVLSPALTIYHNMEDEIHKLVEDTANDAIGEEGRELIKKIEEVKETLKDITDPNKMMSKWKNAILLQAEENVIVYLEEETKAYEIENVYQLAPLVALDLNNTTVNVKIFLYVSRPDKDTSSFRFPHVEGLEKMSYAVLRASFDYDITQPYNLKPIEDAIRSVRFEVLEDSIKERLTEEFEKQQQDLIVQLVPNYFFKYFEVFKRIQNATKVFDF